MVSMLKTSHCRVLISHGKFRKESWLCSRLSKKPPEFADMVVAIYCTVVQRRKGMVSP